MTPPPRLSVITICRNSLPLLGATVDSVLTQRTPDVEYLVVDGGSTDGTVAQLKAWESRGIRWVSERDSGISDAMNKGVRLTSGEWIAHLHADDTYLPGALARLAAEMARNDADVLCGWMLKAEDSGDIVCRCDPERLAHDMTLNHPATVMRREWFDRLGGFDVSLRNAMDYDLFLRAKRAGARFRVVPEVLARFAAGGQSERSLWKTLRETHEIRRRHLGDGWTTQPLYLWGLWLKGTLRIALQRLGLHGFVGWYRRHVAYPPKG